MLSTVAFADAKMTKEAHKYYQNALQAESTQDYKQAFQYIQMAISANNNEEDALLYIKLGGIYTELGEWDNALAAYKKAIRLRSDDAFIYISIGNILQQKQDYQNAYNSYYQAMCIYPDYKYNYINLANMKYILGDTKEATEYYKKFISAYPDHVEARENLASLYMKEDKPQEAADEYAYLYTNNPNAFKNFSGYGLALLRTGDYTNAAEILKKAVNADDTDYTSHGNLAIAYTKLEKDTEALAEFEKTFSLKPDLVELRLDYANLLADMKKYDTAIEQYKMYIEQNPKNYSAYFNMGIVYNRMEKYPDAIDTFKKALSLNSKDDNIKKELARSYHLNKDYKDAIDIYNQLLAKMPDNKELLYNKAMASHASGHYSQAIDIYKKILLSGKDDKVQEYLILAYIAQGKEYVASKNYRKAISVFEEAQKIDINRAQIYVEIANAYDEMGIKSKVIENYERAIEINPDDKEIITQYAKVLSKYENNEACQELMQKVNAEESANMKLAEYSNKAEKLEKDGDFKAAVDIYEKALKEYPANHVLWIRLGNAYKAENNLGKAKSSFEKALEVDPNCSDALFNLGLVYAEQKELAKAKEMFKKSIATNSENAFAYYALGLTYERENNIDEAIKSYEQFINLTNENAYKDSVTTKVNLLKLKQKKK